MRKILILTLVLGVFAAIAYAQTGTTASTTTSTATSTGGGTTTTTTTTKPHHAAGKSVRGSIASVDATAKSFVVHPKTGADVTVKVNDKTKYTPKGKTWDDVKADANVTVWYKNDGTDNWATTVHFWVPKAAKAATTPK
jgi:hypothetical protein